MWKQSVWTSTISSHLATKHLKEGDLLTLAGARTALDGTEESTLYALGNIAALRSIFGRFLSLKRTPPPGPP